MPMPPMRPGMPQPGGMPQQPGMQPGQPPGGMPQPQGRPGMPQGRPGMPQQGGGMHPAMAKGKQMMQKLDQEEARLKEELKKIEAVRTLMGIKKGKRSSGSDG